MVKTKMSAFHVRGHVCHTWNLLRFISSDKSRYHKKCTCVPLSYTSDLFLEVCPNSFWDRTVHQRNERIMPHDDGAGTGRDRLARKPTKENEQSPNGRCRRVAKEYKIFEKPDLCASTRPPEAFKFVMQTRPQTRRRIRPWPSSTSGERTLMQSAHETYTLSALQRT